MKVGLYCRVSKDEMSDSGKLQNTDNQLIPLQKFCEAMQYEIVGTFIDRASGGDSNRPEFQKMLGQVRQKRFDMILVWRLDRFSRESISNTMAYIKQLRQFNTSLKSLNESWLDTSQEGISELILSVMAWANNNEKKKISDNTKAGLVRAKAEGKLCGRHPKDCQCKKHRKTPPSNVMLEKDSFEGDKQTGV
jgi:DNA invertase Pin-like site-specific DNA recombinase